MTGGTVALLVGGGLAAGAAAVYFLRKRSTPDKCANLSQLDARAGALCRLGVLDAAADAASGVRAAAGGAGGFVKDLVTGDWDGEGILCYVRQHADPSIRCKP